MNKDTVEWERLAKKLRKLPYKHRKYDSGSVQITYAKTIRALINVSGLHVKDSKKCQAIILEDETIKGLWKKALKQYKQLLEQTS